MAKKGKVAFELSCPHCQAQLTIDPEVKAVLEHVPPPEKPAFDLEAELKGLGDAEQKRDALFAEQIDAQKKRSDLLDAKFRDSYEKRKDEPVEKPLRDFDLD